MAGISVVGVSGVPAQWFFLSLWGGVSWVIIWACRSGGLPWSIYLISSRRKWVFSWKFTNTVSMSYVNVMVSKWTLARQPKIWHSPNKEHLLRIQNICLQIFNFNFVYTFQNWMILLFPYSFKHYLTFMLNTCDLEWNCLSYLET